MFYVVVPENLALAMKGFLINTSVKHISQYVIAVLMFAVCVCILANGRLL